MATQHELLIRLSADGRSLVAEVRSATGEIQRFAAEAQTGGERANQGFGRARAGVESISEQLGRARQELLAFFGLRLGFQLAQDLVNVADNWGQLTSRIALATSTTTEQIAVQDRLQDISRRSYRAIEETAEVYLRSASAMREVGYASTETLDMVEAVSLGLVVSATSAERGASVIDQFGRAMELGTLRGDAFNTVIANAPALAQALADGLGVTRAELRRMAEAGELTTQRVLPALTSQLEALREAADSMPTTVGDAITILRNEFAQWLGEANRGVGVTAAVAAGIALLARHLDDLVAIAGLVATVYGIGMVNALVQSTAAWVANTLQVRLAHAATVAAAGGAGTLATAMGGLAVTAGTASTVLSRFVPWLTIIAGGAAAVAIAYDAWFASTDEVTVATEALDAALGKLEQAKTMSAQVQALGDVEEKAQALREQLAQTDVEVEQLDARLKAAQGFQQFGQRGDMAAMSMGRLASQLIDARERQAELSAELATAEAQIAAVTGVMAEHRQEHVATAAAMVDMAGASEAEIGRLILASIGLGDEADTARSKLGGFAAALLEVTTASAQAALGVGSVNFNQVIENIEAERIALQRRRIELTQGRQAAFEFMQQQELGTKATKEQTAAYKGKMAVLAEERSTVEAIEQAERGRTAAMRESNKARQDAERAAEQLLSVESDLVDEAERLAAQLKGPGATAQYEYERAIRSVRERLAQMREAAVAAGVGVETLTEAEAAGLAISEAMLRVRDEQLDLLEAESDIVGRLTEEYEEEAETLGLTARELAIYEALKRAAAEANRQFAAGDLRDTPDLLEEEAAAIRASVNALFDRREALEQDQAAAAFWSQTWNSGIANVAGAFGDFVTGQMDSFEDFGSTLVDIAKRTVSAIIAEFARLALIRLFTGQGGSWTDLAMQAMGGLGSGGGAGASGLIGGGQAATAGGGNSGLFSQGSWLQVGRNIYSGFSQAWLGSGRVMPGSQYFGQSVYGPGMQTGFQPTALGYGAAIAGGLYAGYGRWQNNENGAGRFAGAAAYGLGTYTGAMALGGIASGAGAAAGVAGGFSAMGAAAAIPVIGWVALIAMVVDMVAGGKLFGTRYKPDEFETTLGISATGGVAGMRVREERQTALFGGRRARYRDLDIPPEMQRAADEFYRGIVGLHQDAARRLSLSELAPIIEGSFTQVFDAYDDNPLKREFGEILGRTFEEPIEQFKNRLAGANILSAIAAALSADQIGAGRFAGYGEDGVGGGGDPIAPGLERPGFLIESLADTIAQGSDKLDEAAHDWDESFSAVMAIAERWDATGDEFLDGAQFLLAAASDMVAGLGLLGEGGTLSDIADLIEDLRAAGEPLAATYARVQTATLQLETALDIMGQTLDLEREEFVRFAVDITEAAGGVERAGQLWNDFFTNFYGQAELAGLQIDSLLAQRDTSLASIGLDPGTSMAAFREAFEAGMSEMTAAEVARWLEVGAVLAQATQVQREYALAVIDATDNLETILLGVRQAMGSGEVVDWAQAYRDLETANAALIERSIELGASEQELAEIRQFASERLEDLQAAQAAAAGEYLAFVAQFNQGRAFVAAIAAIRAEEAAAIQQANALARAAGMRGAAERDLVAIHRWAAEQIAAAIAELETRISDIVAELYGTSLSTIEEQIRDLEASSNAAANGLGNLGGAVSDMYAQHRAGVQGIQDFLEEMLLGDMTALGPEERLDAVWARLQELAAAAAGGDPEAMAQLPQLGQLYLRLLRDMEASGADYQGGWQALRDLLGPLGNMVFPEAPPQGGNFGGTYVVTASAELEALYAERDRMMAEQEALHRLQLATQLAQYLADHAELTGTPVLELIETLGISMDQLAADLGINLEEITGASVLALANMADLLGIELGALTGALGLELTDLSAGLAELAEGLGIDLSALTVESTQALAGLAAQLGTDLSLLATSLGLDLGDLADAQSLLNQALAATIESLPEAEREALQALFDAVVNATNEADANAALAELEAATNALPPELRNLLAPYLENVFPADALSDLDFLDSIDESSRSTAAILNRSEGVLNRIADNLAAANDAADIPSFDVGTAFVPRDMRAQVHQGEKIIDPTSSAILDRYGIRVVGAGAGEGAAAISARLDALAGRVDRLIEVSQRGHQTTAEAVEIAGREQADAIDRQSDQLTRRREVA